MCAEIVVFFLQAVVPGDKVTVKVAAAFVSWLPGVMGNNLYFPLYPEGMPFMILLLLSFPKSGLYLAKAFKAAVKPSKVKVFRSLSPIFAGLGV